MLRSDYGTENSSLACIQIAFRYYHDDDLAGGKSFIYGPSKSNIVSYEYTLSVTILISMCKYSASRGGGLSYADVKLNGGSGFVRYSL